MAVSAPSRGVRIKGRKNKSVNGSNHISIRICGSGDPYENRTRDTAVKGRCLNRLTNGPYVVAAVRFELTTYRV